MSVRSCTYCYLPILDPQGLQHYCDDECEQRFMRIVDPSWTKA